MLQPALPNKPAASLVLSVWREVCRHPRIEEAADAIAAAMAARFDLTAVHFLRLERERRLLFTMAIGRCCDKPAVPVVRTELSQHAMRRIVQWCRSGEIVHLPYRERRQSRWRELVPIADDRVDVLLAPLSADGEAVGVVAVISREGVRFDARKAQLLRILLEPFANAVANDARLRELARLREAAEADKQRLLSRLGKEDLNDVIIGAEGGLRAVFERMCLVARSDVPVLILGETGTGKEVIARSIHTRSTRAAAPFLRVNCGAIPPELIDSQLFGHEKGSFTGATEQRKGWFERANGGTLFLDEIGELPPAAQVRLLRILQDGQLERVGAQAPICVDVRIIAATHQDLATMVRERRFREDLWYRLAVFPVLLPPLRERLGDLPALVSHFAARAARRFGLQPCQASPQDIELLSAYHWPGNIRELAAVVDRAAILGDGRTLEFAKALGAIEPMRTPSERNTADTQFVSSSNGSQNPQIMPLESVVRRHIEQALRATHGRVEGPYGAARLLQVNPDTLRWRMRKLGIDWKAYRQPRSE